MTLEQKLSGWTAPSSDTEQDKQARTERMIREAVRAHPAFNHCSLSVHAKGSYPNSTNVRADSDVDIAVQCHEVVYYEEQSPGSKSGGSPYTGVWTPEKLRSELVSALQDKFGKQVDASGSTAIEVNSSTSRVNADVTPCFDFKYYFTSGGHREGVKIFKKTGGTIKNYPIQHLSEGQAKNSATSMRYKKVVRILKRVENAMHNDGYHREVPSFFIECLVYNCPNSYFSRDTWVGRVKGVISHMWEELEGAEPAQDSDRWLEVSRCKYLFHGAQKWTRRDGRDFAYAVWNYLDLANE